MINNMLNIPFFVGMLQGVDIIKKPESSEPYPTLPEISMKSIEK
jgi:hypothetical protein